MDSLQGKTMFDDVVLPRIAWFIYNTRAIYTEWQREHVGKPTMYYLDENSDEAVVYQSFDLAGLRVITVGKDAVEKMKTLLENSLQGKNDC